MSVEIKKVNDRHYTVNGKVAQKDMNENWVAIEELTPSESKAFQEYLTILDTEVQTDSLDVKTDALINQFYIVTYDPLGWTGYGQYIIKVDDSVLTPFASVFVGIGPDPEKSKEFARRKAQRIADCLNYCQGIKF